LSKTFFDYFRGNALAIYGVQVGPRFKRSIRKKAVLVAISYEDLYWLHGESMYLRGAHNDALRWKTTLIAQGYLEEDILILWDHKDVSPESEQWPTRKNILRALRKLTVDVQNHQRRFFFFAGHRKGVAADGSDSAILGIDIENPLQDQDLEICLLDPLTRYSTLTIVWDTCRVGNILGIPWRMDENQRLYPDELRRRDGRRILGRVVVLAACNMIQNAREVIISGTSTYHGALTFYLTQSLESQTSVSLPTFLEGINTSLQEYQQTVGVNCTDAVRRCAIYRYFSL